MKINYRYYTDELINLMYSYNLADFKENARVLGHELNRLGGVNALFNTIDVLMETFDRENYSDHYLNYLRDLEFSWSGINPDFQA